MGSTFSFTIRTHAGVNKRPAIPADGMTGHAGKRVLIVDDNLTNLTILEGQLQYWHLQPTLAASGVEALGILAADDRFDLVLTDMQMPFMDGIRLSETIQERHPKIPIILLSSVGDEYKKNHHQLFSAVMTKPIKQQLLYKHMLEGLQQQGRFSIDGRQIQPRMPEELSATFPLRILVAEDNVINQQVIQFILQKMGYEPVVVGNGKEAVEASANTGYDIIFMDLQMPEMDGLEATRLIRHSGQIDQPVIIALTANTMEGDEEECLRAGMHDYIGKPVKLDELLNKLRKWALYLQRA